MYGCLMYCKGHVQHIFRLFNMYVKETTDTFLDSDNTENGDYFQAIISVGSVKSCFMIISFMPRSPLKNKKTSFDEP